MYSSTNVLLCLAMMVTLAIPGISFADEEPQTKADPPKEPSLLDKLSKELSKEVEEQPGQSKPEKQEDKFDRVAKGMRSASEKLDGKQTGDATTQIQEQVIRDLDELIKQLQNPPPNGGGGGGGGGSSSKSGGGGGIRRPRGGGREARGESAGDSAKQQGQGHSGEQHRGEQESGKDRSEAEGSEERAESERKAAAEAARKRKLEIDVWGHLPPHVRDQLINTYGERMLPKYEQLVKQFYEALSEQNESRPRR